MGIILELGMSADRSRTGRLAIVVSSKNFNKLRSRIRRISKRSMREMAKDLNISRERVQFIVKTKLKKCSHKLCCGNYLTEAMKAKLLVKERKMLRLVGYSNELFTDEKP